jgi:hypothetical protein
MWYPIFARRHNACRPAYQDGSPTTSKQRRSMQRKNRNNDVRVGEALPATEDAGSDQENDGKTTASGNRQHSNLKNQTNFSDNMGEEWIQ